MEKVESFLMYICIYFDHETGKQTKTGSLHNFHSEKLKMVSSHKSYLAGSLMKLLSVVRISINCALQSCIQRFPEYIEEKGAKQDMADCCFFFFWSEQV